MRKWVPLIVTSLIVAACARKETDTASRATTPAPVTETSAVSTGTGAITTAAETTYPMDGVLVSRDTVRNTINIDNEAVPGKMAAMKMDYEVRDAKVDLLPADGTRVEVTMHDKSGIYWVTGVKPRQ